MRAAVKARTGGGPGLLAVTALTSMDDADFRAAGYTKAVADLVAERARDARDIGMDGIVCSPREAAAVRRIIGAEMAIVTPGIRPGGADSGDQKRIMGPAEAILAGADFLVVGRPVTAAADPAGAASAIVEDIEQALS
jgi:orotidine-5'-phosphate decarboxylase